MADHSAAQMVVKKAKLMADHSAAQMVIQKAVHPVPQMVVG